MKWESFYLLLWGFCVSKPVVCILPLCTPKVKLIYFLLFLFIYYICFLRVLIVWERPELEFNVLGKQRIYHWEFETSHKCDLWSTRPLVWVKMLFGISYIIIQFDLIKLLSVTVTPSRDVISSQSIMSIHYNEWKWLSHYSCYNVV